MSTSIYQSPGNDSDPVSKTSSDDGDLDLEIKRLTLENKTMEVEGCPSSRLQRGLAWLLELQHRRSGQPVTATRGTAADEAEAMLNCAALSFEIRTMEAEGCMGLPWHVWLRELQELRTAPRTDDTQDTKTAQGTANSADTTQLPGIFHRTVTCAWCGNRYRSACPNDFDHGLQGSHCASDVVQEGGEWFVRGSYGSDEHDMHRYLFVANKPSVPSDPVCDECISERIQAGDLRDTGLECDRRPEDFGTRPVGTWQLVDQIRRLVTSTVAMRRLVDAAGREHDKTHPTTEDAACEVCTEIRAYRKSQRWCGELVDGGEEYAEGCPEIAEQMRDAARGLEKLAALWERERDISR